MEYFLSLLSELEKNCHNDAICIVFDRSYRIIYVSSIAIRQQLALNANEITGQSLFSLLDSLDEAWVTSTISFETTDPQPIDYIQLRSADGTLIEYTGYFQKLLCQSGSKDLMLAVLRNKLLNTTLSDNLKTTLFKAINQSDEAIAILQQDAKILYANYTFMRWYGLTEKELKVLHFYEIDNDLNNQEKWEIHRTDLLAHLHKNIELSFVTATGTTIEIERRWKLQDEGNDILFLLSMIPIKERKETEKKVHKTLERQHILSQIAFILNTRENFEYKINEALRLLGNFLQVDRVLIFQDILNNKATSCSFEWHAEEFLPRRFELQAIPYSLLPELSQQFIHTQYFVYEGIANIPSELFPYFRPYEIHALMVNSLKFDTHTQFGFICLVDHKQQHNWKESDKRFMLTFCEILTSTFRQKQNIDSLVKSERRFRELAELLPEMVCEAAINGKIIFANKHTQVQFGFTENELSKGIIFFNLFHPDDRQRVLDNFEKLLSGENISNEEYTIINREKQEIPVLLYMNIIMQDHLPVGLRAVIVDISERKKREKYLEELASFIETSPFAILEADSAFNLAYLNEKALQVKPYLVSSFQTIKRHVKTVFESKSKIEHNLTLNNHDCRCLYLYNPNTNKVNIYLIE